MKEGLTTPRQHKKRLMKQLGITTGRQWVRFRREQGYLTPKKIRRYGKQGHPTK